MNQIQIGETKVVQNFLIVNLSLPKQAGVSPQKALKNFSKMVLKAVYGRK
jgi:hypothetical protein